MTTEEHIEFGNYWVGKQVVVNHSDFKGDALVKQVIHAAKGPWFDVECAVTGERLKVHVRDCTFEGKPCPV